MLSRKKSTIFFIIYSLNFSFKVWQIIGILKDIKIKFFHSKNSPAHRTGSIISSWVIGHKNSVGTAFVSSVEESQLSFLNLEINLNILFLWPRASEKYKKSEWNIL